MAKAPRKQPGKAEIKAAARDVRDTEAQLAAAEAQLADVRRQLDAILAAERRQGRALSAAMEKRALGAIRQAQKAGREITSWQQIRGHAKRRAPGKTEYAERRERELVEYRTIGRLPDQEKRKVIRFAKWLAARSETIGSPIDEDEAIQEAIAFAMQAGMDVFEREAEVIRRTRNRGWTMAATEFRSATGEGFPNPKWYFYGKRTAEGWRPRTEAEKRARRERDQRRRERRRKRQGKARAA